MSLIREPEHRAVTFECDDCSKTFVTETNNAYAAYQAAKIKGWIAIKVGNCWEHQCSNCRKTTK